VGAGGGRSSVLAQWKINEGSIIEETARLFQEISAWKKAPLLHMYLSETAGLSGAGVRDVPVPMTVLIGIELITNSTEEDGTC
jgi:hypothetical protein